MIKLQNNTRTTFVHGEYKLEPKGILEVPDEVAKILLLVDGVIKYADPEEVKAKETELKEQIEVLKKENIKLKTELEELKKATELEALKKEADALGVEYSANIGVVKLQERINAKKAQQR